MLLRILFPAVALTVFTLGINALSSNADDRENRQLTDAIHQGDVALVRSLVKTGIDVNIEDYLYRRPLLHTAVNEGDTEIIASLVSSGADVNARGPGGLTALMVLAKSATGQRSIIGSGPDGQTQITIAHLLIDHGADIKIRDNKGLTALDYASKKKITQFFKDGQMRQSERYFAPELFKYLKGETAKQTNP